MIYLALELLLSQPLNFSDNSISQQIGYIHFHSKAPTTSYTSSAIETIGF